MLLISVATVLGALASDSYLRREGLDGVEGYALMLLAGTGAMLMAASGGLIMLFLGLEIMSIALYVMAAFHRRRAQSGEAGFKYFILGVVFVGHLPVRDRPRLRRHRVDPVQRDRDLPGP